MVNWQKGILYELNQFNIIVFCSKEPIIMETKSIKRIVKFDCNPAEAYSLIMDAEKHSAFSGANVIMSKKPNGKFDIFDGYCQGYNIELFEGKKIVQGWHFAEDGWPDDHYSTCTFLFEPLENKTKLTFIQTNVPAHKVEELRKGWNQYYWEPIKAYLKNK